RYVILNPVRADVCSKPEEYPWSSYRALMGLVPSPRYLQNRFILNLFDSSLLEARHRYERFVIAGYDDRPWERLKNQIYFGSDEFVERLQERMSVPGDLEIPQIQRQPVPRPDLTRLLSSDDGLILAYREHGYKLREIATFYGVHYSSISRRLKRF